VESNLDTKTPKLNVQNVSSAVFGKDGGSNGSMKNIHGTISKLAGHVRKAVIRIGALEKRVDSQEEKTTKIINILKTQKSNVGGKIPATGGQNNLEKELAEVNKTLVEVQKELQKYFSFQAKTDKEEKEKASRDESRKRLKAEESQLKKSSKNLGSQVKKRSEEIVKPTRGIFDNIMDFVGTLALGIGANAIFEWLKDEKNQKKVQGWFTWIKDHWQWVAGALGIMLALPLVGAITGIVGVIGSLASVLGMVVAPLLALLTNPVVLGALGLVAAPIALAAGAAFGVDAIRTRMAGGDAFREAHKLNAERLRMETEDDYAVNEFGRFSDPSKAGRSGMSSVETSPKATEGMRAAYSAFKDRQSSIDEIRDQMRAEMDAEKAKLKPIPVPSGRKGSGYVNPNTAAENKVEKDVREKYEAKLANLLSTNIEARKMGGPVTRNESYLVGEKGPELFVPNINGSIVNNHRTEKIYQMITSKRRGRGGVNISTLPMQTHELPPPEIKMGTSGMPSTDVPDIPSVNMADPYRSVVSRNILGITV